MAQIVTITNPLTGQPAQVDQLDHTAQQIDDAIARALPGGAIDIALQKKAPAGYGLGGSFGNPITDANNAMTDGKYYTTENSINLPDGISGIFGVLEVSTFRPDKSILQVFRPGNNGYQLFSLERRCIGGTWKPWEWVNPPMKLGEEYRSTERYMGKPVYAKLIDCGNLPNNGTTTIKHGIANIDHVISACGNAKNETDGWTFTIPSSPRLPMVSSLMVSKEEIIVTTNVDWSAYTLYVSVKYTKTTD